MYIFVFLPISHLSPVYLRWQLQVSWPASSIKHVPPFWHAYEWSVSEHLSIGWQKEKYVLLKFSDVPLCYNVLEYYLSSLPISQCSPLYSLKQEQVTLPLPSTWHVPPFLQTSSPLGEHLPFSCQHQITYLCI